MELTGKQRAQLRAMANELEPIVHIGKDGIGENLVKQANDALEARELIKCRVLDNSMLTAREACDELSRLTRSEQVQVIGTKFVLYRETHAKPKEKRIALVKDKKKKTVRVIEVSSTALRAGMASGTSEAMLEPQVYGYILREHLYGTNLDLKRLTVQQLRPIALSYLKAKRCAHVLGTAATAVKLAEKYGADVHRAEVAGLLHDCTKKLSMPEQLALCEKYGIALDALEKKALKLLHAKTGAALARDVFGVDDEIYNAILWHTTGKPDMTVLEKVIYLADFIEPTRDFPGVDALRRTVWEDLDRGLLMGLEMTVEEMEEMGNPIHVNTLAARDYLKGKTNEGKAGSGQQL